jgi:hypothetical protein
MAVPVIDPVTSVLVMTRGRAYAFQPALAPGSDAATSWSIVSGGLPTGLTLNTTTGRISGTPDSESEGSTFRVGLRATNGDGNSATVMLTIGIEYAPTDPHGGIDAVIDLDSGVLGFVGLQQKTEDNRAVCHVRRGDEFPLIVQFIRRGRVIDLPAVTMRATAKRREPDAPINLQALNDYLVYKQGEGETARYSIWLSLKDDTFANDLSEDEADEGTAVPYIGEIHWTYSVSMGEQNLRTARRSTLEFYWVIHRDSLP